MPKTKLKIAIASLTCCEGCQLSILDLGEKFLELAAIFNIADFDFIEEKPEPALFDIAFIEGTPITKANFKRLEAIRKKSKVLVALGACACLGGIQEIKNYQDKNERIKYVYKNIEAINNPNIKPLKDIVKVDLEIPGCPINKEEFLMICQKLANGYPAEHIKIFQRPVCYECQLNENECLLQNDLFCLGPIILGGCDAPCPNSNYPCDGCRGPIKDIIPNNLINLLREKYTQEEIDIIMKRFGALNDIFPAPPANISTS